MSYVRVRSFHEDNAELMMLMLGREGVAGSVQIDEHDFFRPSHLHTLLVLIPQRVVRMAHDRREASS